ncbi:MAG: hypothetical protein LBN09_08430 [Clostridioides sp.]|jgi:uncharacterized membrane protein YkvI|nr:hypothetical protein [Clostridioides sp.]
MQTLKDRFGWLIGPFTIASLWYGIYIGPGFAGGAQLVSYFVSIGWIGVFIGPIITTLAASFLCFFVLEYSRTFKYYNFREFYDGVYGPIKIVFANLKEFSAMLACITISALSFATGGRLIAAITPIPFIIAGLITIFIIAVLILCGQSIVLKSSAIITMALIALLSYLGIRGLFSAWDGMITYTTSHVMNLSYPKAWLRIILYINIMVAFVDAAIPSSKGVVKTKRDSLATAIIGGLLVFLSTIMMNILFASGMPNVVGLDMPTIWVLEHIVGAEFGVKLLYTAIAYLAVISTGAGYLYGMVERYQSLLHRIWKRSSLQHRRFILVIVLLLLGIYFGRMGIPDLVLKAYGLIGKINIPCFELPFLIILPVQTYRYRKKHGLLGEPMSGWKTIEDATDF